MKKIFRLNFFRIYLNKQSYDKPRRVLNVNFIKAMGSVCTSFVLYNYCGLEKVLHNGLVHAETKAESSSFIEEQVSKTRFPTAIEGYGKDGSVHWLVGVSIRCMMGLCAWSYARAYSFGLYISEDGLKELKMETDIGLELTEDYLFKSVAPAENIFSKDKHSPEFIDAKKYQGKKKGYMFVQNSGYQLKNKEAAEALLTEYPSAMLRLIMLRDVKCDHVARGFETTFRKRLKDKHAESKDDCDLFINLIQEDKTWNKGVILDILRLPEGELEIFINGERRLSLQSEAVSFALFDAYTGKNGHLGSKARKDVLARVKDFIFML